METMGVGDSKGAWEDEEENYQERVMLQRSREDAALKRKLCEVLNQEPLRKRRCKYVIP